MQHVLQIVPGFVLGGVLLAQAVHLGQPGHPRLYREPLLLPGGILVGALRPFRSWSHQTHFPPQHIPKLRKFGDAEPAQHPLKTRTVSRIVIHVKPQHGKLRALPADASFPTKGASGGEAESRGARQKAGQRGQGEKRAQRYIQQAFAGSPRRPLHLSELE